MTTPLSAVAVATWGFKISLIIFRLPLLSPVAHSAPHPTAHLLPRALLLQLALVLASLLVCSLAADTGE
jgi:hypothetical protein